jgi:predicted dehydrogenase
VKALVVGLGSIGRRHARNLKAIDPSIGICAWRPRSTDGDLGDLAPLVESVVRREEDALAWAPDVAVVATPASCHVPTATTLARHGVHLLVEKPLSHTLDGVDDLLELCERRSLVLMVGYSLRFARSLIAVREAVLAGRIGRVLSLRAEVGQFLPDWRPARNYRETVSAQRQLGGGAVLEMSHELDYARWLLGEVKAVRARVARLSDLDLDVEDAADVLLEFGSGALGNVHLDMLDRAPTRACRIVGTEGTLTWDGVDHRTRIFTAASGSWTDLFTGGPDERDKMYVAELEHFLACVAGRRTPAVTGHDGRRVLEIALAAKRSSASGQAVDL